MSGLVTGYELNSTFYPPLSRVVTACHGISCDKGGVTHQQT
jgi:hypothetical protein